MKSIFVFLGLVVLCFGDEGEVRIRSVGDGSAGIPDYLEVSLEQVGEKRDLDLPYTLRLTRNAKINHITFLVDGEHSPMDHSNVRFYQDPEHAAVITANMVQIGDQKLRTVIGSFVKDGQGFEIKPKKIPDDNEGKRELMDLDEHIHTVRKTDRHPHVHHDQYPDGGNENVTVSRRASTTHYDVEMHWLSDPQMYTEWKKDYSIDLQKMKEFFGHQANGVDIAYGYIDGMGKGISISTWVAQVDIKTYGTLSITENAKLSTTNPNNGRIMVDEDKVLENMSSYRKSKGWTFNKPDHFMLFTGYDLRGSTVGYAPVGGICTVDRGISAIEYSGWRTWPICAHELGHNLGMHHDGTEPGENGCTSVGNIMNPSVVHLSKVGDVKNVYKFSSCAVNQAKNCLKGLDDSKYPRKCLQDTICSNYISSTTTEMPKLPGEYISLDEQCKDNFDKSDGKCWSNQDDDICKRLWCSVGGGGCTAGAQAALDGSACSNGKWCIEGACVSTTTKPTKLNKPCQDGSSGSVPSGCTDIHADCPQVAAAPGRNCPKAYWKQQCCKSCYEMGFQ